MRVSVKPLTTWGGKLKKYIEIPNLRSVAAFILIAMAFLYPNTSFSQTDPNEVAMTLYENITGLTLRDTTLLMQMVSLINSGNYLGAAQLVTQKDEFYDGPLREFSARLTAPRMDSDLRLQAYDETAALIEGVVSRDISYKKAFYNDGTISADFVANPAGHTEDIKFVLDFQAIRNFYGNTNPNGSGSTNLCNCANTWAGCIGTEGVLPSGIPGYSAVPQTEMFPTQCGTITTGPGNNSGNSIHRANPYKMVSDFGVKPILKSIRGYRGDITDPTDISPFFLTNPLKFVYQAGTNRRIWKYISEVLFLKPLQTIRDGTLPGDRVRIDIPLLPNGSITVFQQNCATCHKGIDGISSALVHFDANSQSINWTSGIVSKYFQTPPQNPFGFLPTDNSFKNYYVYSINDFGFTDPNPDGVGLKGLAQKVVESSAFNEGTTLRVFKQVCGREATPEEFEDVIKPLAANWALPVAQGGMDSRLQKLWEHISVYGPCNWGS